jgi:hypothetical protein
MDWLAPRAEAYRIVFLQAGDKPAGFWSRLWSWFRPPFGVPTSPGKAVLEDLAWRAHMYDPITRLDNNGRADPIQTARIEGKRELYLTIVKMLNLDPSQPLDQGNPNHE